jgi:hypothetical protein
MALSVGRLTAAIAALLILGCSAASACDPGDRVCRGRHLYICKCWCGESCCYEAAGDCDHDDMGGNDVTNFDLLISKYIRQAQLVCIGPSVSNAVDSRSPYWLKLGCRGTDINRRPPDGC